MCGCRIFEGGLLCPCGPRAKDDAPGPPGDAGETPLTIHRVRFPWAAVSGGLYVRGPVSFRARMAVTFDGPPHTATHLLFQRRASVKLYLATVRAGERAASKAVAVLREAPQSPDLQ